MRIPGWLKNTQEGPQQPVEHERLEKHTGPRGCARRIGCGVIVLVALVGSQLMWTKARQDYSIRAEASEGISLSYSVRGVLEEYFKDRGEFPANNEEAGLPPANEIGGNYVSQISVRDGDIVVVFGNKAHEYIAGKKLSLVPDTSKSPELSWTCSSLEIPDKWLTSRCRTP